MADDRIKLGVDFGSTKQDAKQVASSLGDLKESAQDVADTYEVLTSTSARYKVAIFAENDALDDVIERAEMGEAATRRLATSKRSAADAADKAAKSTKGWGGEMLAAGRIAQDFAQGGVGGILNNIEGLLVKFPLLAGAATATATALYVGIPIIRDWYTTWRDGSNEIPPITDALDKMSEALKKNREWMDKVTEKGFLSDDELTRYNEVLQENAQIEKDAAEAKQAKATAEQLANVQTKEAAETAAEASRILKEQLAGKTDEVIASVQAQMTAKSEELRGATKLFDQTAKEYDQALEGVTDVEQINAINKAYTAQLDKIRKIQDEIKARIASEAANVVGQAVMSGNQGAIDTLIKTGGQFSGVFKKANESAQGMLDQQAEDSLRKEQDQWRANYDKSQEEQRQAERKRADDLAEPDRRAEFNQAVSDEMTAQERALNGGLTLAETDAIAKSNRTEFRARQGQASEAEIQRTLAENESMLNDIDQSGGFGSAAYEAFLQTNAQLRRALGMLQQVQMTEQMFRAQRQVNHSRLDIGRQ